MTGQEVTLGFKQYVNAGLLTSDLPPTSSETDADGFTLQVHGNLVHPSLTGASGCGATGCDKTLISDD